MNIYNIKYERTTLWLNYNKIRQRALLNGLKLPISFLSSHRGVNQSAYPVRLVTQNSCNCKNTPGLNNGHPKIATKPVGSWPWMVPMFNILNCGGCPMMVHFSCGHMGMIPLVKVCNRYSPVLLGFYKDGLPLLRLFLLSGFSVVVHHFSVLWQGPIAV